MIRGLYSSATGMVTQHERIDVMGNNVSNLNTTGFKADTVTLRNFEEELVLRMDGGATPIGTLSGGVELGTESTDFTQGALQQTNLDTDLAIEGNGFFAVEGTPGGGGVKYTRDGSFVIDPQGYLALESGERLLGSDGNPIRVGTDGFTVSANGTVTSAAGQNLGTLAVYGTQGNAGVTKRTDGFFDIAGAARAAGQIKQGYIEDSNVQAVTEMTGMMEASRSFQICQQAFQVSEETLDKLITQVGSLKA